MFSLSLLGGLITSALTGTGISLFEAAADPRTLQTFQVAGLKNLVSGTVYPAQGLEQGGMPLGGLGTGYFCLDPDGRIGRCSIFGKLVGPPVLKQPLLYLTLGEQRLTLATSREKVGDIKAVHYFGHFPVADVRYELAQPIRVEIRAFSPFIPGDAIAGNTPVAVFEVHLQNQSDQPQQATLTLEPGGFPGGESAKFSCAGWSGVQVTHGKIPNIPEGVRQTYALAVQDGAADGDAKGVRVWATRKLGAKQKTTIRFLLAWHQKHIREASGRVEQYQYGKRFADARAVVTLAIGQHEQWLKRILAWQDEIYGANLPGWLQEQLVNVPSTLVKNSVWLARTRPDDWWGEEGLFMVNESFTTCALSDTMPCRFFGHWVALFFFPDLERTMLANLRYFQLRDGQAPFCLGLGFGLRDPRYHCQHTSGAGEYAQMIYRYYLRTGDEAFLKEYWPSARDSLKFMLWLDRDGDGLVEEHSHAFGREMFPANNPLDQWPWYGVSSYTAGNGLAALVCGIKMAELVGDRAQAQQWREILNKGRKSYDEKLWTGSYWRLYNDPATGKRNDASFANQIRSVWCTRVLGLEDPLPRDKLQKALDTIARLNLPASPYGMVNAVFPDGKICHEGGMDWSAGCFTQCNATTAMVFLYCGRKDEGEKAARAMLDTIFRGPHAMPWAQPCGLNTTTGGTCWGHDYYDHMVTWSYPLAFTGGDIRSVCAPGGLIYRILEATRKGAGSASKK